MSAPVRGKKNPKPSLKVDWADAGPEPVPRPRSLAALAKTVLQKEGLRGKVNLAFCEDAYVRALNRRFRKLDKVTDVLSFLYDDEDVLGEIYIATSQAKRQAPRWGNSFFEELRRLVVHGSLHLAGYDHMKARDRKVMRNREDFYLG